MHPPPFSSIKTKPYLAVSIALLAGEVIKSQNVYFSILIENQLVYFVSGIA